MPDKDSKVVCITGVTRGLGRAMADGFIARGHTVVGCGRSEKDLSELAKKYGWSHSFSTLDVTSNSAVQDWAARVIGKYGPPDLLLNNAALINANAALWDVPTAEFDSVIDVNIKGTANVLRNFVPAMIARKTGVIINFSSGWGRSTAPEVAPYCATKWAIEGLTQALAQELPAGLAAIPLNPGIINTDMLQSCFADGAANYPTAAEWAEHAVPFLLKLGPKNNGRSMSV